MKFELYLYNTPINNLSITKGERLGLYIGIGDDHLVIRGNDKNVIIDFVDNYLIDDCRDLCRKSIITIK